MAENMEVAETEVNGYLERTANSSAELDGSNPEINDNTLTSESSPRASTNSDETLVGDSRPTNNKSRVTDEMRERIGDSSRAASQSHGTESSGATATTTNTNVRQTPLAFTIDFGDKEVDKAKYQNIFERYNARHRRNLSTSKVEVKPKKPNVVLSPNLVQKQKVPSTYSEGYFSSEDDAKRKFDHLSERLKQLGVKNSSRPQGSTKKFTNKQEDFSHQNRQDLMTRSCDDESQHHSKLSPKSMSLELKFNENLYWSSQRSAKINDLNRIVQTNNYDDENDEKQYTKNIEYIDHEYKEMNDHEDNKVSNMNYITDDDFNIKNMKEKEHNSSSSSYGIDLNADNVGENTNLDAFNVSNVDADSDGAVSEAGTYTIHKDYTDEEKARMDIDKVFSVGVLTEDESNEVYVHNFKMNSTRDNNAWISEWATQVAEHNSLPPIIGGSTGRASPMSPTKIPSPIHGSQRVSRNRYEQPDNNLAADSYVRIKERINLSQHQIIDSGGESDDDDTSNSYNTPPNSSQRTPVHSAVARRSSLSESLFRRANSNETRRSVRKYLNSTKSRTKDANVELLNNPSQVLSVLHFERRSSSLDRKEYASDTTESNTSRRNSMQYQKGDFKHTNSPVLSRLRPPTPKLTNSPIVNRKATAAKILNSPTSEKPKHLVNLSQMKNVGYFTCVENSPYMLRKSKSTTNYHEETSYFDKDVSIKTSNLLQNSPELQRHLNVQRSSSNTNIKNVKSQSSVARHSSFNSNDTDRAASRGKVMIASDSSSETGENQQKRSPLMSSLSSGIKLNRAFSIRRARLNSESDTTPNTTPEERRRRAQSEIKTVTHASKQQNYHRARTNSAGTHNKDPLKNLEPTKYRPPSISRTDTGRFSMRASKSVHHSLGSQKTNQKPSKDHKKSGRSNSTLTSKEVEFQNWKRRKSYDPMKAAAEGRKKLIDTTKKHHSTEDSSGNHDGSVLRSASFHGTGGALSLANDWSDNELNCTYVDNQAPPPSSPQLDSDSDLDTSSYLQTTQNVVSNIAARMTEYCLPLNSDNESDEDTSHRLHPNMSKRLCQRSDTESSDEQHPVTQFPISNIKEFSLGRTKLDPQRTKLVSSDTNKAKPLSHDIRSKTESLSVGRTDSGRSSARVNRTSNIGPKSKPRESKKLPISSVRDVEMQNWKRRKSYDPMKAAMEGKRKASMMRKNISANLSPSPVAKSQSFHGSVRLAVGDWSDEELVISADEVPLY